MTRIGLLYFCAGSFPIADAWRRRHDTSRASPHWARLSIWLLATATTSLLVWSFLGCTVLPLFDPDYQIGSVRDVGACILVAGFFWASVMIALAVPVFAALMVWHVDV